MLKEPITGKRKAYIALMRGLTGICTLLTGALVVFLVCYVLWLILEAALCVELLLTGGEHELVAALFAN